MPTVMNDVVEERDQRRDRHPPLEHDGQVDHDREQEDDQSGERLLGDLLTPGRTDDLRGHRSAGTSTGLDQSLRDRGASAPGPAPRSGPGGRDRWRCSPRSPRRSIGEPTPRRSRREPPRPCRSRSARAKTEPPSNSTPNLRPLTARARREMTRARPRRRTRCDGGRRSRTEPRRGTCRMPRSVMRDISGLLRGGATLAGDGGVWSVRLSSTESLGRQARPLAAAVEERGPSASRRHQRLGEQEHDQQVDQRGQAQA